MRWFLDDIDNLVSTMDWTVAYVGACSTGSYDTCRQEGFSDLEDKCNAIKRWCAGNCEGKWFHKGRSSVYGFELETDIVLFHLTWGKS